MRRRAGHIDPISGVVGGYPKSCPQTGKSVRVTASSYARHF